VRLFEAVLAQTGERVILKEFLPIMRNLAASEIECVMHVTGGWMGWDGMGWDGVGMDWNKWRGGELMLRLSNPSNPPPFVTTSTKIKPTDPNANQSPRLYGYLYEWVRANAPDWRLQDLPVVPLYGCLETGVEVSD
jgi:hypothetical protein